jgi:hypothetical protein
MAMHDISYIVEPLRMLAEPIEDLNEDSNNARRHNDRNLAAIEFSLNKFGQRKPIVVQREGMVVRAGNGTLAAARRLGWSHIAAVIVDEPHDAATAFALADNRSGELAEWDWTKLGEQLGELNDSVDLQGLGWEAYELEPLLSAAGEWNPEGDDDGDLLDGALGSGGEELETPMKGRNVRFSAAQRVELEDIVAWVRDRTGNEDLSEGACLIWAGQKVMGSA